jgi:hypothetical protein
MPVRDLILCLALSSALTLLIAGGPSAAAASKKTEAQLQALNDKIRRLTQQSRRDAL